MRGALLSWDITPFASLMPVVDRAQSNVSIKGEY